MRKLFTNEITDQLITKLSSLVDIKTIVKGDLSRIPKPEMFSKFMPMIIVKPMKVTSEWANINEQILSSQYPFKIFYLKDYDFSNQTELLNISEICINEAEPIAELLLEDLTLGDFKTENGQITSTICSELAFDNANFEFFRELEIPAAIVEMNYIINFRTYSNKRKV